jgi:YggT family protein
MQSILFLIRTLGDLYVMTFVLRFLLQWVRADFYNPLAQFVVRATNPLVVPARRLIPAAGGVDLPTLIVMVLLEAALIWTMFALVSVTVAPVAFVLYVVLRLISTTLYLYMLSIFLYVILSWIAPGGYHPVGRMLADLNEPLLWPLRRILPPIAGLDLAPMLAIILIIAARMALPLPPFLQ